MVETGEEKKINTGEKEEEAKNPEDKEEEKPFRFEEEEEEIRRGVAAIEAELERKLEKDRKDDEAVTEMELDV